jgi:acyl carrier protein
MTTPVSFSELAKVMQGVFNQHHIVITPETTSSDVPGWDSLSHVTLMLEIESVFGVTITPFEAAELPNVGALYELLEERSKSAP